MLPPMASRLAPSRRFVSEAKPHGPRKLIGELASIEFQCRHVASLERSRREAVGKREGIDAVGEVSRVRAQRREGEQCGPATG